MKLNKDEVRYRLTLKWPKLPESNDPTEDNPHHIQRSFLGQLWQKYYLGPEWGDEATFGAERRTERDGTLVVVLESDMPEAMGEVMNWFAMEMSYHYPVGTSCIFEKVGQ